MILLCYAVQLYVIILFARIILSWFPITPGSLLASVFSVLYNLTEPVLGPLRRLIPPLGMFDLSPLIVFFVIQFLLVPLLCS